MTAVAGNFAMIAHRRRPEERILQESTVFVHRGPGVGDRGGASFSGVNTMQLSVGCSGRTHSAASASGVKVINQILSLR